MHFASLSLHNVVNVTLRRQKVEKDNGESVEWLEIVVTDDTGREVTIYCHDTPVVDVQCEPIAESTLTPVSADEVINYQPSPDVVNVINLLDALKRTLGDMDAGNHPAPDHWSDHPVPEW